MVPRMPNRFLLGLAALCLAGTAACASAAETRSAPQPAEDSKADQAQLTQSAIADCMKQEGFKYVAWTPDPKTGDEQDKAASGDYEAMRAIARKRGFGIFTTIADPSLKEVVWSESDSPNFTIKNELSPAQLAAYDKALESCRAQAVKKVTGRVVRSAEDLAEQRNQMIDQTLDRELNGDPELIELAAAMGDCLKGKGYRIDSVRPADIGRQVPNTFEEQLKRIALNDDIPEEGIGEGRYIVPRLAPATARQWADKEIKAALDDVECGKDFYAAYEPRNREISDRVTRMFGGVTP
ncbi:hypothetical protein GCM10023096_45510 [Nonomuraea ferruginea]